MASLKSRLQRAAARILGTSRQTVPVPYELICACGYRVAGIRRPSAIIATCNGCGASLYVSPVDVYPATKRIRNEVPDENVANRAGTVNRDSAAPESPPETAARIPERSSGVDPEDDLNRSRRRPRRHSAPSRTGGSNSGRAASVPELPAFLAPVPENAIAVPKVPLRTRLKRLVTPVRLLGVASLFIVVMTAGYMVRQRQAEADRRIWRQEMDRVDAALRDGDPLPLRTSLTKAVAAGRRSGRSDAEFHRACLLLQQTESLEQLSQVDLIDRLSAAGSESGTPAGPSATDLTDIQTRADSLRGEFYVLESPIRVVEAGSSLVSFDLKLVVNGTPVRIYTESDQLARLAVAAGTQPVLIVARIAECRAEHGREVQWQIRLDAESCCLITTLLHAQLAGFTPESTPGLGAILERQSAFLTRPESGTAGQSSASPREGTSSARREPGV